MGGVPLARDLFSEEPAVDRITRRRLVERVLARWRQWQGMTGGTPEEYIAHLADYGGPDFLDAVWYVSLLIALKMGRLENVGMRPTVTRHNLDRTTGVESHETFWTTIFRRTKSVAVVTTNYDILAERGLRISERPRVHRPGFHYGYGSEDLEGSGYPSYAHIRQISVSGHVPLLKIHGSISWSLREGRLVRYQDCRPAIRGDAAIVAPMTDKKLPDYFRPIWNQAHTVLSESNTWIVVGYSLPEYDLLVRDMLRDCSTQKPQIHVFDPDRSVVESYERLLQTDVVWHVGLPAGIADLESVLC